MKNIFYFLLITTLFFSCKSNTKQTVKDSTRTIKPIVDTTLRLIQRFKSNIQGVWVYKDYIDAVAKSKSPFLAFKDVGNITAMVIDTKAIKGDSLLVGIGYGNHEGGDLMIKFHSGSNNTIIAYNPGTNPNDGHYELGYSINKSDTALILYTINKEKKTTEQAKYSKVLTIGATKELGDGTDYIINKILISGSYILTDTLSNKSKVKFTNDGKVVGFSDFKTYLINNDFTTPPGNNMDQIIFDLKSKNKKIYAFKIDRDTLNLYQTSYGKDSIDLILGKRIYKLIKQK
ncbi:MAG TPA: hypothetical protein VK668_18965 [Mucilaginibacter sp.]|nr:hypothetical protein [Mucilaginibacter sp.]